ncbi:MAG TPA: CPBP family intramembrane glutamic endopeptidase [Polyangiaceae bacterium]|jgi:membrane protease YdiL (CAAX protease family)
MQAPTSFAVPSISPSAPAPALSLWGSRLAATLAFIALWVGLGFGLHLGPNAYIVLGVPLAIAFQRWVARAPLRAAWVQSAPPLRIDRRTVTLAALVAIGPAKAMLDAIHVREWGTLVSAVAATTLGSLGVAYTLRNMGRAGLARHLKSAALAALPGIAIMILAAVAARLAGKLVLPAPRDAAWTFVDSLAQYVPATFAVEEVVFRGVLDAHVAAVAPGRRWRVATTVILCAAWGLWHAPVVYSQGTPPMPFAALIARLLLVHIFAGLTLTYAWRRTGSLFASGVAHALVDAVRNALFLA